MSSGSFTLFPSVLSKLTEGTLAPNTESDIRISSVARITIGTGMQPLFKTNSKIWTTFGIKMLKIRQSKLLIHILLSREPILLPNGKYLL